MAGFENTNLDVRSSKEIEDRTEGNENFHLVRKSQGWRSKSERVH